ncbi:MAG: hypothetical protein GXO86_10255 [Chlorobi bacterium]|nr:hypothetical protein [Chlorobiota bacterium]
MKKLLTSVVLGFCTTLLAIGQSDYKMLELVYLKPVAGADLEAASRVLAAHNKKYHSEDPYKATVWSNLTGSMVGTWVWAMYPATFTAYDNRPSGKDHEEDWNKTINPYFEIVANEYWQEDDKLSYFPENYSLGTKVVWTIYDVRPGDNYRFKALLKKVAEVYKQKKYETGFVVYRNQFENKDGRDVAIETMFSNWSFLDKDNKLKKDYDELHGEGSWSELIEEYRDIVIASEDELSVILPEMSVE